MTRISTFLLTTLVSLSACAEPNPWGSVSTPSSGEAHSIGSYANGCLAGAQALPLTGDGYQVMRPSRNRFYGQPVLIDYIENLSRAMHSGLLIGDLAQPRGGPMTGGHGSHQIGLDVDMWYRAEPAPLNAEARENLLPVIMVQNNQVTGWNSYYTALLRDAATPAEVDRIFVHPAIKRELCATQKHATWLRKIRPWWGHDDHFHVRLRCPAGDETCTSQAAVPNGNGCGPELDWWFSDEAKAPPAKPAEKPALPAACDALLAN